MLHLGLDAKETIFGRRGSDGFSGRWLLRGARAVRGGVMAGRDVCLTELVGFRASLGGDGCTLVCVFWEFKETLFQY